MPGPLTLADIADARAYEREREEFRAHVIAVKKVRRVSVGPVATLVFENHDTIRFQIQEMARAERLYSDEAIQVELDTYNPLLPGVGRLAASLFVELTSRDEMEHWLPRLVGIERAVYLRLGEGEEPTELVNGEVEADHATRLTRETTTAAVHFVYFQLTPAQTDRFGSGEVAVVIDHPEYREAVRLGADTKLSLETDLLG